jgi:ketosteroid isomerase-like protein
MIDAGKTAEAFIEAYNGFDLDAVEGLLDENVQLIHHNRGFATTGREETIGLFRATPDLIPDRRFIDRKSLTVDGNVAIVRHALTGTPTSDMPFGPAGEPLHFDIASVFTVGDDGKVVRYEDYG